MAAEVPQQTEAPRVPLEKYLHVSNVVKGHYDNIQAVKGKINARLRDAMTPKGLFKKAELNSKLNQDGEVMSKLSKRNKELKDEFAERIASAVKLKDSDAEKYSQDIESAYKYMKEDLNDVLNNRLKAWIDLAQETKKPQEAPVPAPSQESKRDTVARGIGDRHGKIRDLENEARR